MITPACKPRKTWNIVVRQPWQTKYRRWIYEIWKEIASEFLKRHNLIRYTQDSFRIERSRFINRGRMIHMGFFQYHSVYVACCSAHAVKVFRVIVKTTRTKISAMSNRFDVFAKELTSFIDLYVHTWDIRVRSGRMWWYNERPRSRVSRTTEEEVGQNLALLVTSETTNKK